VLGPWVNEWWLNLFTGAVVAILVMLSIILTASVLYPEMSETTILAILCGGSVLALGMTVFLFIRRDPMPINRIGQTTWRMPPISELPAPHMIPLTRIWMIVLRGYLVIAGGLVLVRIIQLATAGQG
jgi:hypothetical protein